MVAATIFGRPADLIWPGFGIRDRVFFYTHAQTRGRRRPAQHVVDGGMRTRSPKSQSACSCSKALRKFRSLSHSHTRPPWFLVRESFKGFYRALISPIPYEEPASCRPGNTLQAMAVPDGDHRRLHQLLGGSDRSLKVFCQARDASVAPRV